MKKFLLFSFASCVMLSPLALSAQKKTSAQKQPLKSRCYSGKNLFLRQRWIHCLICLVPAFTSKDCLCIYANLDVVADTTGVESAMKRDSILNANKSNRSEFIAGLKAGLDAPEAKNAYNTGLSVGGQILKQMMPGLLQQMYGEGYTEKFNNDAFVSAMYTAMSGGTFDIENPAEAFNEKMQDAQAKMQAKQEEAQKAQYADQIAEGDKFMEENKAKDGVVTLPSGLQYKVITNGTGEKANSYGSCESSLSRYIDGWYCVR
jgi:FKBP-type peptidyl-prolyl cis-trans isomerases 1